MEESLNLPCNICDWGFFKTAATDLDPTAEAGLFIERVACNSGGGSCLYAELSAPIETTEKSFFPSSLRGATTAINAILATTRAQAPPGRKLAFLLWGNKIMLAFVETGVEVPANAITRHSDADTIEEALGYALPAPTSA